MIFRGFKEVTSITLDPMHSQMLLPTVDVMTAHHRLRNAMTIDHPATKTQRTFIHALNVCLPAVLSFSLKSLTDLFPLF
jgi:hypothetical protein